jgi:transcriptional regulator with XRE-family HTH domain
MNQLKKLRVAAGLTQSEIATKLGVSQPHYQRWETSALPIPDDRLTKLAKLFKTTPEAILGKYKPIEVLPSAFPAGLDGKPESEHYYGEAAIHFQNGKPLLLSISLEALKLLSAALHRLNRKFITVKSLCNQTAVIRTAAVTDIYFTYDDAHDELGGFGPEADDYEYEDVHLPDPRDWHIIELLRRETAEEIIKQGCDPAAVERIAKLFNQRDVERIQEEAASSDGTITPENVEKVVLACPERRRHAARLMDLATQTVYQLANGKRRSIWITREETFIDPIASLVENEGACGETAITLAPDDDFERSIFINLDALDYITVPTHKLEAAELEFRDETLED